MTLEYNMSRPMFINLEMSRIYKHIDFILGLSDNVLHNIRATRFLDFKYEPTLIGRNWYNNDCGG